MRVVLACLTVAACSSTNLQQQMPIDAGPGSDGAPQSDLAMTTTSSTDLARQPPGQGLLPMGASLGTYIVLGDSISDRGGESPFFYDLLHDDLTKKFPSLMFVHAAQAGAITDNYSSGSSGAPLLKDQIAGLGHNYPGDILVTITIGGNDLTTHAIDAISGSDATDRTELRAHLDAELGELTMAGRLGSGKVYIVEANIYDASDGQGNWYSGGPCGPQVNVKPALDVQTFDNWNGVISAAEGVAKVTPFDLHLLFAGHGFNAKNAADRWYVKDCIHPTAVGHDAIRRALYRIVTGDDPS